MAKTILVTGGAGGICSEISRGLAADGLNVVVADYAKEELKKSPPRFAMPKAAPSPCRSMSAIPRASRP